MKKIINILFLTIIFLTIPTNIYAACSEYCNDVAPAVRLVKHGLIPTLQLILPIGLIAYGMVDFPKAVTAGKEEEMKKVQSIFVKNLCL